MIEKWLEWKAIEYFTGLYIAAAVIAAIGTLALIIWIYKKMCEHRKKRLEWMCEKLDKEGDADGGMGTEPTEERILK